MYSTAYVGELLDHCDSVEEMKKRVLPILQDQREQWRNRFARIMKSTGLTQAEMAKLCGVSEAAVRKWKNGALPQSRDLFLRIGFAAGYDRAEMDEFLQHCGRLPGLYVRNPEDSVCIFVLQSEIIPHTAAAYEQILEAVQQRIAEEGIHRSHLQAQELSTRFLHDLLTDLQTTEEILRYAEENAPAFFRGYRRFYSYVMAFLEENMDFGAELSANERKRSFHEIAMESGWPSSLRHCLYDIRKMQWIPRRSKVISLGLHLNMDVDSINYLLKLANMEPLYPKNPMEAAVIWSVTDFMLGCEDGNIIRDGSTDLRDWVKKVLGTLDHPDCADFLDEL